MQQSTIESRRHIVAGGGEGGSLYGVLLNRETEMKKCEQSSPAGLLAYVGPHEDASKANITHI